MALLINMRPTSQATFVGVLISMAWVSCMVASSADGTEDPPLPATNQIMNHDVNVVMVMAWSFAVCG